MLKTNKLWLNVCVCDLTAECESSEKVIDENDDRLAGRGRFWMGAIITL